MTFQPAPYPDDVEDDFGPYSRDEIVVARTSLLHTVQRENNSLWQSIKYKLGILPNGYRLSTFDPDHVWLPHHVPDIWSAPVKLHDPHRDRANDCNPEGSQGMEYKVKSRLGYGGADRKGDQVPWGSGALATDAESSWPSDQGDGDSQDSGRSPNKRRRKDSKDDGTPSHFQGDHMQNQPSDLVAKKSQGSASSSTSVASASHSHTSVDGSSTGQGSSADVKGAGGGDHLYEVVYQCDFCPHDSQDETDMQHHLSQNGHYSASRFLAQRVGAKGKLRHVYLSVAGLMTDPAYQFQGQVAACPTCHSTFRDLRSCLDHSLSNHKRYGQYSFRHVDSSHTFQMQAHSDLCTECHQTFEAKGEGQGLHAHMGKTGHMALYDGQKTEDPMLVFLCPCCPLTHANYFEYKEHVFSKHAAQTETQGVVTAACIKLGRSQPARTMPPRDPGIPMENILYDFSKAPLPGDPGFRGVMTKSKLRRLTRKLRRKTEQLATHTSGQQQSRKKKKKKKDKDNRKERLTAFKEKMHATGTSKKKKNK